MDDSMVGADCATDLSNQDEDLSLSWASDMKQSLETMENPWYALDYV